MDHRRTGASPRRPHPRPLATALALLCAWLSAACMDASRLTGPTEAPPELPAAAREYVAQVNEYREEVGCRPLVWHPRAAAVAQRHSEDMVARNFFSHTNPDGKSPWRRLAEGGVGFYRAGENLARGQTTSGEVLGAWLASPAHRRNIETCAFTHHGLGIHQNRWTHVFVRP